MVPLLSSESVHGNNEAIAYDHSGNRMMVRGDWKIVQQPRRDCMLFNIAEDPSESRDLAAEMPEQLESLMSEFYQFGETRNYIEVNSTINQP